MAEVNFDDMEYVIPGEALRFDLRTGPQAQLEDHQRRIAELESRLRHAETLLHHVLNRKCVDDYGDAIESADSV